MERNMEINKWDTRQMQMQIESDRKFVYCYCYCWWLVENGCKIFTIRTVSKASTVVDFFSFLVHFLKNTESINTDISKSNCSSKIFFLCLVFSIAAADLLYCACCWSPRSFVVDVVDVVVFLCGTSRLMCDVFIVICFWFSYKFFCFFSSVC